MPPRSLAKSVTVPAGGFSARHGLTLDWVYVAKMMYGIYACAERGTFAAGTTVVAVITG